MSLAKIFLIGIIYFFGNSTAWSFGTGYFTLYRPVISGFLTGLVLGKPFEGMLAGAVVNILYLNFVSTGGSLKGDPCLTGITAVSLVVLFDINHISAAAFAYPFGLIGILLWKFRLNINNKFAIKMEKSIENNNISDITIYNVIYPQLILLILSIITFIVTIHSSFLIFKLSNEYIMDFEVIMFLSGIFLIALSTALNMSKVNSKIGLISFIVVFIGLKYININSTFLVVILFTISIIITFFKDKVINS